MGKSLKNFTYDNKEIADEIYAAVNSTQFLGVSVCKTCYSLKVTTIVLFLIFFWVGIRRVQLAGRQDRFDTDRTSNRWKVCQIRIL